MNKFLLDANKLDNCVFQTIDTEMDGRHFQCRNGEWYISNIFTTMIIFTIGMWCPNGFRRVRQMSFYCQIMSIGNHSQVCVDWITFPLLTYSQGSALDEWDHWRFLMNFDQLSCRVLLSTNNSPFYICNSWISLF